MHVPATQPAGAKVHLSSDTKAKRGRAHGTKPDDPVQEAAAVLFALLDLAFGHASARAEQVDAPGCTVTIDSPFARRYRCTDAQGEMRGIAVSLLLSVTGGCMHGGAFISTSRPYVSFFVAPVVRRGTVRWRVGTSGQLLTSELVEDLFLSVFDDDDAATRRLAPLVAYSLG